MKNEWKNIDETTRNRLEEALNQREMNFKEYSQEWFEDGQIDEVAFCENFLQRMPLKCINGIFFSYDGMLPDSEVEKEIYRMVKPVLTKGISKKVKQLLEVLKLEAYSEELPVQMDRIHVNNGTYFLNGDFTENRHCYSYRRQGRPQGAGTPPDTAPYIPIFIFLKTTTPPNGGNSGGVPPPFLPLLLTQQQAVCKKGSPRCPRPRSSQGSSNASTRDRTSTRSHGRHRTGQHPTERC